MSGKERSKPQKLAAPAKPQLKKRHQPDQRIRRTCERLGNALLTLIQERPIDDVTVQQVLDRAGVGRSTFYVHYRDKDDLLFSQLEMFLEFMSTALSARQDKSHRVAPVEEMFAHIGQQNKLLRALVESGRLHDFFELAQGYFARGIERRLREFDRLSKRPPAEVSACAVALAGSLLSLLRWWIDRQAKQTPREMDKLFHHLVWDGLK